jgi:membrane-associated phospholipid phosphatase
MTAFARWLSVLAHPFVMVAIMVTAAALRSGGPGQAARIVPMVLLITLVPVAVLMARQVRRGAWKHADASDPLERRSLFVVCILGVAALLAYFQLTQAQSFVIRGALVTLGLLMVCASATRWLKVSLHMAFATLAAAALLSLGSALGWVLLALLPLLAWARLFLARHTLAEVVAGALIGLAAAGVLNRL